MHHQLYTQIKHKLKRNNNMQLNELNGDLNISIAKEKNVTEMLELAKLPKSAFIEVYFIS